MNTTFACTLVSVFVLACSGTTTNIDGGATDGGTDGSSMNDGSTNDSGGSDASMDTGSSDGSGGPCANGVCAGGLSCCNGECVNESNDPHNCGGCGSGCISSGGTPMMCYNSMCVTSRCQPGCSTGQICCEIEESVSASMCVTGTTCPVGCPLCQ